MNCTYQAALPPVCVAGDHLPCALQHTKRAFFRKIASRLDDWFLCLCGLWKCCLHLTLRRYSRFFRLKASRDMHGGGHDPEVLKELHTASDLAPRATKVMARSLGCTMSTLVVQERHLWLCLVGIGMPTKSVPQVPCVPDWPLQQRNREHGPAVPGCTGAD